MIKFADFKDKQYERKKKQRKIRFDDTSYGQGYEPNLRETDHNIQESGTQKPKECDVKLDFDATKGTNSILKN